MDISNVDSWNNIKKYADVEGAFFIFDEQRVVGYGAWVKAFIKIARHNKWILLSATPGDKWMDYVPVFIANGFYRNKSEFVREHVVWNHHTQYPSVDRYVVTGKLLRLRNSILVNINYKRKTTQHHIDVQCTYDSANYRLASKLRRNLESGEPLETASEYCLYLQKIVNSSPDRAIKILDILEEHERAIIFYNYNYELDILRSIPYKRGTIVAEWNGHEHDPLPDSKRWVYLVQYTAGAEGWNCITTDTMIFYSQSYSYRATVQAAGRIDRRNTQYTDLYYYHLLSKSTIDISIKKTLNEKKEFNYTAFAGFKKKENKND
jgi:superfamily II DNA or RNA helicase